MSKSTKERVLNYVPKNDTIQVPGKEVKNDAGAVTHTEGGEVIAKDQFTIEHLDRMVARARNRKISVHTFLSDNGLVHVAGTPELFFEEDEEKLPEGKPDSSWKNADIKKWLEEKEIDVPANTNKEGLLALVETVE